MLKKSQLFLLIFFFFLGLVQYSVQIYKFFVPLLWLAKFCHISSCQVKYWIWLPSVLSQENIYHREFKRFFHMSLLWINIKNCFCFDYTYIILIVQTIKNYQFLINEESPKSLRYFSGCKNRIPLWEKPQNNGILEIWFKMKG